MKGTEWGGLQARYFIFHYREPIYSVLSQNRNKQMMTLARETVVPYMTPNGLLIIIISLLNF